MMIYTVMGENYQSDTIRKLIVRAGQVLAQTHTLRTSPVSNFNNAFMCLHQGSKYSYFHEERCKGIPQVTPTEHIISKYCYQTIPKFGKLDADEKRQAYLMICSIFGIGNFGKEDNKPEFIITFQKYSGTERLKYVHTFILSTLCKGIKVYDLSVKQESISFYKMLCKKQDKLEFSKMIC